MDTLIELIVRGLIALFSGGNQQSQSPTPRPPPRTPPQTRRPGGGPMNRQSQYPQRPPAMGRGTARNMPSRGAPARGGPPRGMPPIPLPAAPPLPAKPAAPKAQAPATATSAPPTTITASAIRQLLKSRRSALRTVFVLSEVVGPPVGLRESD